MTDNEGLPAGKLNRRIRIQRRIQAQDVGGQLIDGWVDVAKPWTWIKGQTGMGAGKQRYMVGEGTVAASVNFYSFRIRYRPWVTDAMRVLFAEQAFDIKQVRHDLAGKEWTDLVCEQGGNDG